MVGTWCDGCFVCVAGPALSGDLPENPVLCGFSQDPMDDLAALEDDETGVSMFHNAELDVIWLFWVHAVGVTVRVHS